MARTTAGLVGAAGGSSVCPSPASVLDGVYHPERLDVLDPCRSAAGSVVRVRHEDDGDVHLDVALAGGYRDLLRSGNYSQQDGALVVEFMPRDGGHLPEPSVGDSIRLVGAWVDDTQHDWNELHPVWAVSLNGGAWRTSGPRYGGDPGSARSYNAASECRTAAGGACTGYGYISPSPAPQPAPASSGDFCSTHRCIPSFDEGTGTIVQCSDGMWSHSGGRPGVCSGHGGER